MTSPVWSVLPTSARRSWSERRESKKANDCKKKINKQKTQVSHPTLRRRRAVYCNQVLTCACVRKLTMNECWQEIRALHIFSSHSKGFIRALYSQHSFFKAIIPYLVSCMLTRVKGCIHSCQELRAVYIVATARWYIFTTLMRCPCTPVSCLQWTQKERARERERERERERTQRERESARERERGGGAEKRINSIEIKRTHF